MTGFTACVFLSPNRVSLNEALEVLEPDDGKLSRPVLSGGHPLRGGCVSLKLVQSALWSGRYFDPSSSELESAAQPGSAAKAVFSMERLCPILSMAPALAIV